MVLWPVKPINRLLTTQLISIMIAITFFFDRHNCLITSCIQIFSITNAMAIDQLTTSYFVPPITTTCPLVCLSMRPIRRLPLTDVYFVDYFMPRSSPVLAFARRLVRIRNIACDLYISTITNGQSLSIDQPPGFIPLASLILTSLRS